MPTYVAFLRAINLGANRKFPKDAIRACVEGLGFTGVETHINTGNVRFDTAMRSRGRIEAALEEAFHEDRGFEVPTMVFTAGELAQVGADVEELADPDAARHYVYLLKEEPGPDVVAAAAQLGDGVNRVVVRGRAAHVILGPDYQPGTVDPFRVERLVGVATNRNASVIRAMVEKWCRPAPR